jgi:hypothetical protein
MAKIGPSGIHSGMQVHQLMARGFTRQGADELLAGNPITQANDLTRATAAMAKMNMGLNLQCLQLQKNMLDESRRSTTIANIMKSKHDTAKSIINNIR